MMFFKRREPRPPLDLLKEQAREDQTKTDEAYERLLEVLKPSERLQEKINKAVGK